MRSSSNIDSHSLYLQVRHLPAVVQARQLEGSIPSCCTSEWAYYVQEEPGIIVQAELDNTAVSRYSNCLAEWKEDYVGTENHTVLHHRNLICQWEISLLISNATCYSIGNQYGWRFDSGMHRYLYRCYFAFLQAPRWSCLC